MYKRTTKNSVRKEIYITAAVFVFIFVGMIVYLISFMRNDSKEFIYNSYNSRFSVFADDVTRGGIYTADGIEIAKTEKNNDGKEVRVYPDDRLFSHAVGYVDKGMSGLEAQYSFELLKTHITLDEQINNSLTGSKSPGDSLYTTFDYNTQKAAYEGLKMFKGAAIAIEPDTGKIVSMVSMPDYNPNTIAEKWDEINDESNNNSVLLNRATNGAYPPGSTFKIITTLAYLRATGSDDFSYNCKGNYKVDDYTIHCSSNEVHGKEDLTKAFSNSCNSAYASIGVDLDREQFIETANNLLFNQTLPTLLKSTRKSTFKLDENTKDSIVAQTAIGQGETLVSPLHMCMIVSAIANNGNLMKPYMADKIVSANGEIVSQTEPESYGVILSENEVNLLNSYMEAVVTDGTAEKVNFGDLTVYGKTGTAEYTTNKKLTHSWFVGYAEDEYGKQLAVAVIMESAGYGSKYAAPLAADIFNAYFDK